MRSLGVEKKLQCHTALDAVSHGFEVEEWSSLEVEQKYRHCEHSEFTPEAIQLRVGVENPTTELIRDLSSLKIYPSFSFLDLKSL